MRSLRHVPPVLLALAAVSLSACGGGKPAAKPAPGTPGNPLVAEIPATSDEEGTAPATRTGKAAGSSKAAGSTKRARSNEAGASHSATTKEPSIRPASKPAGSSLSGAVKPAGGGPTYQKLVDRQTSHPQQRFTPCNLVTAKQAQAIVGAPMQAPVEAPQGPSCIYRTQDGKRLIALAVQATDFSKIKPQLHGTKQVAVSGRAAYCGTYGQPMLYVPLSPGRVLSISAPCTSAKGFALRALPHL